jgi:hypothetical protein
LSPARYSYAPRPLLRDYLLQAAQKHDLRMAQNKSKGPSAMAALPSVGNHFSPVFDVSGA